MNEKKPPELHKNDMYGDLAAASESPAIPAATVCLLRDGSAGVEVLMLRKTSKIAFGGMWVFPGGKIDAADYPEDRDLEQAARTAASREAAEEAALRVTAEELVWFAHWTPPPNTPKRFATFFFLTHTDQDDVIEIDGGEIEDHRWISPGEAISKHREGEIDLAPPTWVTLFHLSKFSPAAAVVDHFRARDARVYETHVGVRSDGVRVAIWAGDAGYESADADAPGTRHRLSMARDGFEFEHPEGMY